MADMVSRPKPDAQQKVATAVAKAHIELENTRFRIDQPLLTYFSDMTDFAVDTRPTRTK
jgi:hypothetical protein